MPVLLAQSGRAYLTPVVIILAKISGGLSLRKLRKLRPTEIIYNTFLSKMKRQTTFPLRNTPTRTYDGSDNFVHKFGYNTKAGIHHY